MRAFEPERPVKILNPFTVDAGHFQIATNLVDIVNLSHAVSFISQDLTAPIEFFSSIGTDQYTPAV